MHRLCSHDGSGRCTDRPTRLTLGYLLSSDTNITASSTVQAEHVRRKTAWLFTKPQHPGTVDQHTSVDRNNDRCYVTKTTNVRVMSFKISMFPHWTLAYTTRAPLLQGFGQRELVFNYQSKPRACRPPQSHRLTCSPRKWLARMAHIVVQRSISTGRMSVETVSALLVFFHGSTSITHSA